MEKIANDVARMHIGRVPPHITSEDVRQDARTIGLSRYKQGYRGTWLAQRIWGDMKDSYGRQWKHKYKDESDVNPRKLSARESYVDPDAGMQMDVHCALDLLSPLQRQIIIAIDIEQDEPRVLAKRLGVPVALVLDLHTSAQELLRSALAAYKP